LGRLLVAEVQQRSAGQQVSQPNQVITRSRQFDLLFELPATDMTAATQTRNHLHPAENFFYFLS